MVFTQGCPHNCPGCHNQRSIPFDGGELIEVDEVINQILEADLKRVTFSGGEPFVQAEQLYLIAKRLKKEGYNLWSYSGYTFEALLRHRDPFVQKYLSQLDILIDGRFLIKKKTLAALFRGSTNQRIIDVQASIQKGEAIIAEKYRDEFSEETERINDIFI
ncbi:anaerobic ribonucleoside-triphosphate reductase activating protein [Erysipelothrix rhusiopathiae SY1027]|nr:anaerobic ribonucleoside-triphosphate reductase activating protein [Erysipelothrix rhusiopathiae SY1027]